MKELQYGRDIPRKPLRCMYEHDPAGKCQLESSAFRSNMGLKDDLHILLSCLNLVSVLKTIRFQSVEV